MVSKKQMILSTIVWVGTIVGVTVGILLTPNIPCVQAPNTDEEIKCEHETPQDKLNYKLEAIGILNLIFGGTWVLWIKSFIEWRKEHRA